MYNSEIKNVIELTEELVKLGHNFGVRSDMEVMSEWDETCVERFRGMFAFAIWDRNNETLFLARGRLGIKPLYYALGDPRYNEAQHATRVAGRYGTHHHVEQVGLTTSIYLTN